MFTIYNIMFKVLFPKVISQVINPTGARLLPEAALTATLCNPFRFCCGRVLKYASVRQDLVAPVSIKALHSKPCISTGKVVPHSVPITTCSMISNLCLS